MTTTADMDEPREILAELVQTIEATLPGRLLGIYLFGSLAAGDFYPGRSDLDLVAVLASDIGEDELDVLRVAHEQFEAARPAWHDRIEVLYISRDVLHTFAAAPTGIVARISPSEPMQLRDLDGNLGWLIDWHGVLTAGETLVGPAPLDLGPDVGEGRFREAVRRQLRDLRELAQRGEVAYVPVQQGYIVATVCRALCALATRRQTSKRAAIEWFAEIHPDSAEYVRSAYRAYRADVRDPHERLIRFVADALANTE